MNGAAVRTGLDVEPFPAAREFNQQLEPSIAKDRRSFLGFLAAMIGAGITGLLGVTLGRYSIVPALAAASVSDWVDLGKLEAIPPDKPKKQTVMVAQNAGWGRFTSEQSVWLIKQGEQVKVFSSVCPHLGCTINENANGFGCVCHNSSWTRDGLTAGGPTPRGMDQLEHKVEDGILKVKYQTFKQGLKEKVTTS